MGLCRRGRNAEWIPQITHLVLLRHELIDGRGGQDLDQVGAVGRRRRVGTAFRGVAVGDVHPGGDEVAVVAARC